MTQLRIRADWREYWEGFKRKHGKNPVLIGGRWLFPDGWSYARDKRGPEFPPPEEPKERARLIVQYWRVRKAVVDKESELLQAAIESVKRVQRERDAADNPQFLTVKTVDETGKLARVPVHLGDYEHKLEWLRSDALACLDMIAETESLYA